MKKSNPSCGGGISTSLAVAVGASVLSACVSSPRSGPYAPQSDASRDTAAAQRLSQEAAGILDKDPAKAERLLRDALTADVFWAPAHNSLGIICLKRGDLYQAASEFQWAAKLLPGVPEPRMNLALTLERAGRTDQALSAYGSALEVYPDHLPTLEALARLQVRARRTDDRTKHALEEIAMRGETERWREWARQQLARAAP